MYALQDSIREDSEIGKHQRQRRRSSFIDETFRKWVPLYSSSSDGFFYWCSVEGAQLDSEGMSLIRWGRSRFGKVCTTKISAEKFRLKEGSGLNSGKREPKPTPTPQMKRTKIQSRDSDRTGLGQKYQNSHLDRAVLESLVQSSSCVEFSSSENKENPNYLIYSESSGSLIGMSHERSRKTSTVTKKHKKEPVSSVRRFRLGFQIDAYSMVLSPNQIREFEPTLSIILKTFLKVRLVSIIYLSGLRTVSFLSHKKIKIK